MKSMDQNETRTGLIDMPTAKEYNANGPLKTAEAAGDQ
jgi:hypothetical protein